MQLTTFENEISGTILQRGKDYFSRGAVTDLQDMGNGQWFAVVEGNDNYEVDIRLGKKHEVLNYTCNCPFDGEICKHIVAVLYQIREEVQEAKPVRKSKEQDGWKKIISVVPEDELREFLTEYAAKNKDFRNKLIIHFAEHDNTDNRDKYRKIINNVLTTASGRHGFIDYHHAFGAMRQVSELLAKADNYLDRGIYKEAFYIAEAVAPECINAIQYMDDSDGECGGAINDAFHIILQILQSDADESLKNEVFDWLLNEAGNPDYDDYGCADDLYPLLTEVAHSPERAARVIAFFDEQLRKAALKNGWTKEYRIKNFLGLKIDLYIKTGDDQKAEKIISDNMHVHDFRKIVVERHLTENKYDEAIRLIEEGIQIAIKDNYQGIVTSWKELLMDIYRKQNNVKKLRAIAKELYYSGRFEKKYYLEYKSTFKKDEWGVELENIINWHKKEKAAHYLFQSVPYHLAAVYIEEKMWNELYGLLEKSPDIHSLLQYSHYLVKDYANELVLLYKNAIDRAAEKASKRKDYRQLASYILNMAKIPGGKETARLLISKLITKYDKRPAMRDELEKISILDNKL
jgi:hypothetical protein